MCQQPRQFCILQAIFSTDVYKSSTLDANTPLYLKGCAHFKEIHIENKNHFSVFCTCLVYNLYCCSFSNIFFYIIGRKNFYLPCKRGFPAYSKTSKTRTRKGKIQNSSNNSSSSRFKERTCKPNRKDSNYSGNNNRYRSEYCTWGVGWKNKSQFASYSIK